MEFHQLKTFVAVAETGSITRASARLNLSQPAVSAHIKQLEETLGLSLFSRTARGMHLTVDGRPVLERAKAALEAHSAIYQEAKQLRGTVSGKLRLAAAANAPGGIVHDLMSELALNYAQIEVSLTHTNSFEMLSALRAEELDAGFCVHDHLEDDDLSTIETDCFSTYLAAPAGMFDPDAPLDWQALAECVWIMPSEGACCRHNMERLFLTHNFRPRQTIVTDRESATRDLVASGVGVGILHAYSAHAAEMAKEADLLCPVNKAARVAFVCLARRRSEPVLHTVEALIQQAVAPPRPPL